MLPTGSGGVVTTSLTTITTGTNGLGAQSAIHLAKHNAAHIYISGRNAKSAENVIKQIRDHGSTTEVTFIECDLASLSSVKQTAERFAAQTPRLDILMCNAGIMAKPPSLTPDGYELQFGTNHLGHALLINKFLPLLEKRRSEGGDARIVLLTSEGWFLHPRGGIVFDALKTPQDFWIGGPWRRYGQSKLANMLYARELSSRYPDILSVSVHPGVVATDLIGESGILNRALIHASNFGKILKPEQGAYNQVWAATAAREKMQNGSYYEPVGELSDGKLNQTAKSEALAKRLWEWTEEELKKY